MKTKRMDNREKIERYKEAWEKIREREDKNIERIDFCHIIANLYQEQGNRGREKAFKWYQRMGEFITPEDFKKQAFEDQLKFLEKGEEVIVIFFFIKSNK